MIDQIALGIFQHFLVIQCRVPRRPVEEYAGQRLSEEVAEQEPEYPDTQTIAHARKDAVLDPAVFLGAVILARVSGKGDAERVERRGGEVADLGRRRIGRNDARHFRIQRIESGLLKDTPDRRDGKLKRHGKPQRDMPAPQTPVYLPVLFFRTEHGIRFKHIDEAGDPRGELTDDGSGGRARIAHLKRHDKEKVEPDIEQGRRHEDNQRSFCIADSAERRGGNIIQHRGADSAEAYKQVPIGVAEILVGRLHQAQEGFGKGHGHRHQKRGEHQAELERDGHALSHALVVARAEPLAGPDGEARRKPRRKAED